MVLRARRSDVKAQLPHGLYWFLLGLHLSETRVALATAHKEAPECAEPTSMGVCCKHNPCTSSAARLEMNLTTSNGALVPINDVRTGEDSIIAAAALHCTGCNPSECSPSQHACENFLWEVSNSDTVSRILHILQGLKAIATRRLGKGFSSRWKRNPVHCCSTCTTAWQGASAHCPWHNCGALSPVINPQQAITWQQAASSTVNMHS